MAQQIYRLYLGLRARLAEIEERIESLKAKFGARVEQGDEDVRRHLEKLRNQIEQGRSKIVTAQAEVTHWLAESRAATGETGADSEAKPGTRGLRQRADEADRYAAAATDIALATIEEAEAAALEAWLKRHDAASVKANQPAVGSP